MKILNSKNIFIFFLIILTFAQTAKLWFVNYSSHNFFNSNITSSVNYDEKEMIRTLKNPYKIILGIGDGNEKFIIKYNNLNELITKINIDTVLVEFLEKGSYIQTKEIDWKELLKRKVAIYEYSFRMPTASFINSFEVKSSLISNKTKYFNSIVITPDENNSNDLSLFFLDTVKNLSYEYKFSGGKLQNDISKNIESDYLVNNGLSYTSTILSGYGNVFTNNFFLPFWEDTGYYYNSIISNNPYLENNEGAHITRVSSKIEFLFASHSSKIPSYTNNNIFSFSSGNIVVNYDTELELLEYNNYKTINTNVNVNFDTSYSAAMSFILKDKNILNEFYLSSYENNGKTWIFTFDYTLNDIPLLMSDNNESEMKSPIIVTVKNNIVTNYKSYVINYMVNEELTLLIRNNFIESLDKIGIDSQINNLELFYNIDGDDIYKLYWLVEPTALRPITMVAN